MGFMYAWTDTPHLEAWIDCEHGDWHGANTWNLRGIFVPQRHSRQGPLRRNGWATSRDFHRRFRLFHQLHRREESRRIPGCIHSSEGGDRRRSHFVSFFAARGTWSNFDTRYAAARGGSVGFAIALLAALWAYDGWNNLNMVAGEVRSPGRNIPLSLIAGVGLVGALYMLMNAAVQYVMPSSAIAASPRPASEAVLLTLGAGAASLFSGLMAIQMLATLNGTVLSGSRVPFAAARDGEFFPVLATVHPKYHTPSTAIIFQACIAAFLILFAGNFQQLFSMTLFAEWLFYMITSSTVFVFRRTEPNAMRPYKTLGYPVVPLTFIFASAVLLVYTFAANLKNSTIGSAVILAGIPVHFYFRHRSARVTRA